MKARKVIRLLKNFAMCRLFGRKYISVLCLRVTNKCMYNCKYCNIPRHLPEPKKEDIFKTIDAIEKDCFFLTLCGGEPLLRDDIEEIIDYIRKKGGMYILLDTNGALIRKKIDAVKKVHSVQFSLDGPMDINDGIRGKGSFASLKDSFSVLRKHKIPFFVNFNITRENYGGIDGALELSKEMSFPIFFTLMQDFEYGRNIKRLTLDDSKLSEVLAHLISKKKDYNIMNSVYSLKNLIKMYNCGNKEKCSCGRYYFMTDFQLNIYPCIFMVDKFKSSSLIDKPWSVLADDLPVAYQRKDVNCARCNVTLYYHINGIFYLKYLEAFKSMADFIKRKRL